MITGDSRLCGPDRPFDSPFQVLDQSFNISLQTMEIRDLLFSGLQ
jgi:hypothetical protein